VAQLAKSWPNVTLQMLLGAWHAVASGWCGAGGLLLGLSLQSGLDNGSKLHHMFISA